MIKPVAALDYAELELRLLGLVAQQGPQAAALPLHPYTAGPGPLLGHGASPTGRGASAPELQELPSRRPLAQALPQAFGAWREAFGAPISSEEFNRVFGSGSPCGCGEAHEDAWDAWKPGRAVA